MRVLALLDRNKAAPGAVEIYRITMPLEYLNNKTRDIRCGWMTMGHAAAHMERWELGTVLDYDLIILHGCLSDAPDAGKVLVQALRSRGAQIVYEADDDYSGLHRQADVVPGRDWSPYLGHVDAITVTTKPLAQLARRESGSKPVHVIPNAIDRKAFSATSQSTVRLFPDNLVIMLAGTRTHVEDWKVVAEAAPRIAARYPQVKFVAACEPWYYDYLPEAGFEFLPTTEYAEYPCVLAQADILCAPLVPDDPFNASKSPIKAIEGWCAGCVVVATDCTAYRHTVQHRHNGLLVEHTPQAWEDALCELIEDGLLRQKLQVEGYRDSRRYDIETRWQDWARVYRKIVDNK